MSGNRHPRWMAAPSGLFRRDRIPLTGPLAFFPSCSSAAGDRLQGPRDSSPALEPSPLPLVNHRSAGANLWDEPRGLRCRRIARVVPEPPSYEKTANFSKIPSLPFAHAGDSNRVRLVPASATSNRWLCLGTHRRDRERFCRDRCCLGSTLLCYALFCPEDPSAPFSTASRGSLRRATTFGQTLGERKQGKDELLRSQL